MTDDENLKQEIFEELLSMWDSERLINFFHSEYRRGYRQGRNDYRDELLAKIGVGTDAAEVIEKRKPEPASCSFPVCSGTDQCADAGECLGLLFMDPPPKTSDSKTLKLSTLTDEIKIGDKIEASGHPADGATIIDKLSSVDIKDEELSDLPDELASQLSKSAQQRRTEISAATTKNAGGRPSNDARPPNAPTNLAMVVEAIGKLGGKASGQQIRDYVRKTWWPTARQDWTNRLYDFVKDGKLARDGINFVMPIPVELPSVLPKEPSAVPMPPVQPTAGPRPDPVPPPPPKYIQPPAQTTAMARRAPYNDCTREPGDEKFEWLGKSAMLKPREYMFCKKLVAVKGHHIGEQFLAESMGLRRTEDRLATLRNLITSCNPKIAPLGIEVAYFQGFGFIVRDLSK